MLGSNPYLFSRGMGSVSWKKYFILWSRVTNIYQKHTLLMQIKTLLHILPVHMCVRSSFFGRTLKEYQTYFLAWLDFIFQELFKEFSKMSPCVLSRSLLQVGSSRQEINKIDEYNFLSSVIIWLMVKHFGKKWYSLWVKRCQLRWIKFNIITTSPDTLYIYVKMQKDQLHIWNELL